MVISFQQNKDRDPYLEHRLFQQRKSVALQCCFALLFALIVMLVDARSSSLHIVRRGLSCVTAPMQWLVNYPVLTIRQVNEAMRSKEALLRENQQLKDTQLLLQARLQQDQIVAHEQAHVAKLLAIPAARRMRILPAHVLSINLPQTRQILVLDKGRRDGVRVGLPVMDAHGVLGQVIDLGEMTSAVLLLSDIKSAIPVRNERTGEGAILVGEGHEASLSLMNLPKTSRMRAGDALVTSGLDRRYPAGYPVGRIASISHQLGDEFIHVDVKPRARLNQNHLVLLLWPETEQIRLTHDLHQRLAQLEGLL